MKKSRRAVNSFARKPNTHGPGSVLRPGLPERGGAWGRGARQESRRAGIRPQAPKLRHIVKCQHNLILVGLGRCFGRGWRSGDLADLPSGDFGLEFGNGLGDGKRLLAAVDPIS